MGTVHALRADDAMVCAKCGTVAACDCGVEFVPALEAGVRAVLANRGKTNRVIAEETKISLGTINSARKAVEQICSTEAPETRVGRDGKSYPARREPPSIPKEEDRPRDGYGKSMSDAWVLEKLRFVLRYAKHLPKERVIAMLERVIKEVRKW